MSNAQNVTEHQNTLHTIEDQVEELAKSMDEQDMQIWAYLIGGLVALLVGVIGAYYYTQIMREKRKSRLDRIKDALREGIRL
jgi:hypothetical protein